MCFVMNPVIVVYIFKLHQPLEQLELSGLYIVFTVMYMYPFQSLCDFEVRETLRGSSQAAICQK